MRRSLLALALLGVCGCSKAPGPKGEQVESVERVVVVEQPGAQPTSVEPTAQAELDRTIWDCEWNIAVFWGPHWHRAHRDVARMAMGGGGLFSREDYELSYGPGHSFSAAIRHVDYPSGERGPQDFDDAPLPYSYVIEGDRLTITAAHWDEPLECVRGCYDQAFIEHMDRHYDMHTPPEAVEGKMRTSECGG